MAHRFFLLFIFVFFLSVSLFAGVGGKITGTVVDAESGEGLPGVNIILEGTLSGCASAVDGSFFLLNVPPGRYNVTAHFMGYQKVTMQNVNVSIDLTTKLNFKLSSEVLDLGETVYITAERPLITKDLTASTAVVNSEDIDMLPVSEFQEILELQAGMIDGHVRGGRSGEVVYAIDGVPVTDAFDGSTVIDVNTQAIEELQFVSGAFNAEYGRAMSGYVNIATKEADDKIRAGLTTYTGDYLSNHTQIFRGIDQLNPVSIRNVEGFISGPILSEKLYFFGNVRYAHNDGWMHGRNIFNPWDITVNHGPAVPTAERYDIQATGDSSLTNMNWNSKSYIHCKLTWKPLQPIKLNYNFMLDDNQYQEYNHEFSYNPSGDLKRFRRGMTHILGLTHVLNQETFYQFNISWFDKNYKHYVYENPLDSRYTHYRLLQQHPQDTPSFKTGGTQPFHFDRQTSTLSAKFDLTSQITPIHQVKIGAEITQHDLDFSDVILLQQAGLPNPSESGDPYAQTRIPDPFDPNENLSINEYTRRPLEFSAYVQDKIELDDMVINAGLRYDYFQPDGFILADPSDPDIYRPRRPANIAASVSERRTFWYKDATAKHQVSPRLGVSFPITDKGVFHFSYGHFFQIPNFELLYLNPEYKFGIGTGNLGMAGNPDLDAEMTINGEVGFSQALTEDVSIDVTGYFRDIRNLAGTRADEIGLFGGSGTYSKIVNSDFGFVRGIVLTVNKRFSDGWSGKVDYTLQTAKGNSSDPAQMRLLLISGQQPEIQLIPLNFDQTHTINASLTWAAKQRWAVSFIANYGSGFPYTPLESVNISKLLLNSETKPNIFNVNLKAHKDFLFSAATVRLFARIYNLFDIRNELDVYSDSGTAGFTIEEYLRRLQGVAPVVNSLDEYYRIPTFYSEPRRVEIGLSVNLNK